MQRLDPKNRSVVLLVRVAPALARALDARAAKEGTTRSVILRRALVVALQPQGSPRRTKGADDAKRS